MSRDVAEILRAAAREIIALGEDGSFAVFNTLLDMTDPARAAFLSHANRHYGENCAECLGHMARVLSPSGKRRKATSALNAQWVHARMLAERSTLSGEHLDDAWLHMATSGLGCDHPVRDVPNPHAAALAAARRMIASPSWSKHRGTENGAWKLLKAVYVAKGGTRARADNLDHSERDA